MDKAISLLSVIPVRCFANHKSEMVTQLIWGDLVMVLERKKKWFYIRADFDKYEGWIFDNQVELLADEEYKRLSSSGHAIAGSLTGFAKEGSSGKTFIVPASANLYDIDGSGFSLSGRRFEYDGVVINSDNVKAPLDYAMLFLDTPYMWGGRTAMGIDCSALVQVAFKMAGMNIERDASDQAKQGELVDFLDEARPGDLLFFNEKGKSITHVGLLAKPGVVIHAHGKVRLDPVDQQGIFNVHKNNYSHRLRLIKRVDHSNYRLNSPA